MSTEELLRSFFASIIALALSWAIFDRSERENTPLEEDESRPRYVPFFSNTLLPVFIVVLLAAALIRTDAALTAELMLSVCFGIFLHICLYYLLLLLAMPLLHQYISARACATLWLLPNYLYLTHNSSMQLDRPAWIIPISKTVLWIAFGIWLAGCLSVLIWKWISHLRLRRKILKPAVPVTDSNILELWQQEQQAAGCKKSYQLVVSPSVTTPLSIGFFARAIRVILPERTYTPGELRLIFRHELVHVGRGDSGTKFFFAFCIAMCWFNPLMWLAMRRSADDLELSCDETVLLSADDAVRRQYAQLLLRTAGDERGFTTSLSASAQALRYRLKNVVKPRKRFSGALTVGLVFFLLITTCGYVTLSYGAGTGTNLIFDGQEPSQCTIENINWTSWDTKTYATCTDTQTLNEYLAGLNFRSLTGSYSFPEEEHSISLVFHGPKGAFGALLSDHTLKVTPLYNNRSQRTYYISADIDWVYMESLLLLRSS